MKNLNFKRKGSTPTKDEIRKLIEVEKKRFFKNGGVMEVLKAHIGPGTPSCFTKEWDETAILGIPSEIDDIYKQVAEDSFNFLNEKYADKINDY